MKLIHDSCFVGRVNFLDTLHTMLLSQQRVVVTGVSGIGKTAAVRTYAQQFVHEYPGGICWINASTDETLLADILMAMQAFALPIDTDQNVTDLFQSLHNHLNTQPQALLILDNLPAALTIQKVSNQSPASYHLLLITQTFHTEVTIANLALSPLNTSEGTRLLLHRAGLLTQQSTLEQLAEQPRARATELACEIHGWPLALNLAGAYPGMTGCSIEDYLDLFRSHPVRSPLPIWNDQQELIVTCELSLIWLEQTHPYIIEALKLCALLSPEAIPDVFLAQIAQNYEGAAQKQDEVRQLLLSTGFLDADPTTTALSMHPLIQSLLCQFFTLDKQPQQQQIVERALRLLQPLLSTLKTESLPMRLYAIGHIQHLAQLSAQIDFSAPEAAEVFAWAATQLWEQHMLKQAEKLLRRALSIWEHAPEPLLLTIATVTGQLATLNGQLKNYTEAEAWSHRAIASKIAALGVKHPDVLQELCQLGQYYAAQNKQKEAQACYEKAIAMGEQFKLRLHPVYSAAEYQLALLSIKQEDFEQAEKLLQDVCRLWKHTLGKEHPSTVIALLSLAKVAAHLQHWEVADTCYKEALPISAQVLGKEYPEAEEHRKRVARVSQQAGNLAENKG